MKILRLLNIFGILLLAFSPLYAQNQDPFLQKARNYLDAGECDKAETAYEAYKVEHPAGNAEVKRRIVECKDIKNEPKTPVKPEVALPTVTTLFVEDVTTTSAICWGNVTSEGSSPLIERGICYDVYKYGSTPDIKKKAASNSTSSFIIKLTGLEQGRKYIIRAYATNSEGTSYGEAMEFTTKKEEHLPPPQKKTYKIGDDAKDLVRYSGYRIAYLDATGEHGWAIRKITGQFEYCEHPFSDSPTINQLQYLYQYRYTLGLYGEYWSKTEIYGTETAFTMPKDYTFDFSTGETRKRREMNNQNKFRNLEVEWF